MSLFDYKVSRKLSKLNPSFAALIMAAMRSANSPELNKLQVAFPAIFMEYRKRRNMPGGKLPEDEQ